ncbi:hypothetical protein AE618_08820 [Bosea vaviloviae]|uniref:TnsA endonuclease N-terminal domain-containing protein n=1 Tax=Bosea vaviloviae TaxID=1526658 RepID=A0A0N1N4F7_9HYPH|nr:hypothetical protein AE618_08820 [Bosea vaviloviae]
METLKARDRILAFDSLEAAAFHEAAADPHVELIVPRPHRLLANVNLEGQRQMVAFNPLLLTSGSRGTCAVAVRYSWERAKPHCREIEAALTRAYRRDHGVKLRWRTELQLFAEPRRTNRRRLAACVERADPELTASIISQLQRSDGRMTVRRLNRELGGRRGWEKFLELLIPMQVDGFIELALDRELTERTLVQLASPHNHPRPHAVSPHRSGAASNLELA